MNMVPSCLSEAPFLSQNGGSIAGSRGAKALRESEARPPYRRDVDAQPLASSPEVFGQRGGRWRMVRVPVMLYQHHVAQARCGEGECP